METLTRFTWEQLAQEISHTAPTLHSVFEVCTDVKRRERKVVKGEEKSQAKGRRKTRHCSNTVVLGVCAGILLRHHNHHMNFIQRLVSLILHSGHCAKQVS